MHVFMHGKPDFVIQTFWIECKLGEWNSFIFNESSDIMNLYNIYAMQIVQRDIHILDILLL